MWDAKGACFALGESVEKLDEKRCGMERKIPREKGLKG